MILSAECENFIGRCLCLLAYALDVSEIDSLFSIFVLLHLISFKVSGKPFGGTYLNSHILMSQK